MVGHWVYRERLPWWYWGKAHFAESQIADRIIAYCGRQLPLMTSHGRLKAILTVDEDRCRQCAKGRGKRA